MSAPASVVDQCSRLKAVVGASASDCIDCVRTMLITALWLAVTCLVLGLQAVSGQVPVSFDHGERSNHIYCQRVGSPASIAPSCVAESYNLNVSLSNVAPPYRSPCFMTDGMRLNCDDVTCCAGVASGDPLYGTSLSLADQCCALLTETHLTKHQSAPMTHDSYEPVNLFFATDHAPVKLMLLPPTALDWRVRKH